MENLLYPLLSAVLLLVLDNRFFTVRNVGFFSDEPKVVECSNSGVAVIRPMMTS
jgi:hypothetical protein